MTTETVRAHKEPGHPSLRLAVIAMGVVVVLLASFLLLFVLNVVVEALFYSASDDGAVVHGDPGAVGVPVNALRVGFAVALVVLYPLLLRTHLPQNLKAVLVAAPVGVATAAAGVTLYNQPALAWSVMAAVALVTVMLLRAAKLSWPYHASAFIALVLATAYAWPTF